MKSNPKAYSLAELLRRQGQLPLTQALGILLDVLSRVKVGHEAGAAPLSLSPELVRLDENERVVDAPATDLYQVGELFFEMIFGRPPFEGETDLVAAKARGLAFRPGEETGVPDWVVDLLRGLLEPDPARRSGPAAALCNKIEAVLDVPLARSTGGREEEVPPSIASSDQELAARSALGQGAAFDLLVRRHHAPAFRLAACLAGPEAAPELTSAAFVAILDGLDPEAPPRDFPAHLRAAVQRCTGGKGDPDAADPVPQAVVPLDIVQVVIGGAARKIEALRARQSRREMLRGLTGRSLVQKLVLTAMLAGSLVVLHSTRDRVDGPTGTGGARVTSYGLEEELLRIAGDIRRKPTNPDSFKQRWLLLDDWRRTLPAGQLPEPLRRYNLIGLRIRFYREAREAAAELDLIFAALPPYLGKKMAPGP